MVLVLGGYPGLIPGAAGGVLLDLLWAAALLVLALGVRRAGSVVARRPLGVVALAVAAAVPFASMLLWTVVPPDPRDNAGIVMLGQGLMVLSLAALHESDLAPPLRTARIVGPSIERTVYLARADNRPQTKAARETGRLAAGILRAEASRDWWHATPVE